MVTLVSQIAVLLLCAAAEPESYAAKPVLPGSLMVVACSPGESETADRSARTIYEWRDKGSDKTVKRVKGGLNATPPYPALLRSARPDVFSHAEPAVTLESQSICLRI